MTTMADQNLAEKQLSEKQQVLNSDFASSGGGSSPPEYVDDLPDPDAGKSDAERAALVRLSLFCLVSFFSNMTLGQSLGAQD